MKSNGTTVAVIDAPEIEAVTELAGQIEGFASAIAKKEALSTADEVALEKIGEALVTTRSALDLGHVSSDNTAAFVRSVKRVAELASSTIEVKTSAGIVSSAGLSDGTVRREVAKLANQIVTKLAPAVIAEIHERDTFRAARADAEMRAIAAAYADEDLSGLMNVAERMIAAPKVDHGLEPWRFNALQKITEAIQGIRDAKVATNPALSDLISYLPVFGPNLEKYLAQRGTRKAA